MGVRDQSLKRKTTAVIMLTSVAVLLLTVVAFTVYDLVTYRQNRLQSLSATAAIIANHSSAALARGTRRTGGQHWPPCVPTRASWRRHCMTAEGIYLSAIPSRPRRRAFRRHPERTAGGTKRGR